MTFADLSGLPSVSFAPQSAGETETAIITAYEAIAKATLQPGDPVRLFLESLAYILSVQNGLIDLAGKQNLLAYARGGHLDHLGAPMGVIRIQPQPARTTVRFGVDEALAFAVPIPAGTRVTTQSGGVMFATLSDAVREILRPAADIHESRARMISERIHRKIAPQQIGAQAARKRHAVRPPVV